MSEKLNPNSRGRRIVAAAISATLMSGLFAVSTVDEKPRYSAAVRGEAATPRPSMRLGEIALPSLTVEAVPMTTTTVAQAKPKAPLKTGPVNQPAECEKYRPLVARHNWPVDIAMLAMKLESGCDPNIVSPTNDHGLMGLHDRPVYDPAQNIKIAYDLYLEGRVGDMNFSAWYTLCTFGTNPQPQFAGVNCQ